MEPGRFFFNLQSSQLWSWFVKIDMFWPQTITVPVVRTFSQVEDNVNMTGQMPILSHVLTFKQIGCVCKKL